MLKPTHGEKRLIAMRRNRIICTLLSIGVIGGLLGHGMFAATLTNEKSPTLLSGSLDNVLGVTVSPKEAVPNSTQDLAVRVLPTVRYLGERSPTMVTTCPGARND